MPLRGDVEVHRHMARREEKEAFTVHFDQSSPNENIRPLPLRHWRGADGDGVKFPAPLEKVAALAPHPPFPPRTGEERSGVTRSPIQVSDCNSAAARNERRMLERRSEGWREGRRGERGRWGRMSPPLLGLSVSRRGGERQATMGPFSAGAESCNLA